MEKPIYDVGEDVRYMRYVYNGTGITVFDAVITEVIDKEKRVYKIMDKRDDRCLVVTDSDIEEEEKKLGKNFGSIEFLYKKKSGE